MKISVVIPVLNERLIINGLIKYLSEIFSGYDYEVIVSDGDSQGSTIQSIDSDNNIILIRLLSPAGRAMQMNMGAASATGDIILFLHADTYLPYGAASEIESAFKDENIMAGAFNLEFYPESVFMKIISFSTNMRSHITRIPFGDQGIFIRRDYFEKTGGYKMIPLMEDMELMTRLRRSGDKIYISKLKVKTSARKWEADGIIKNTISNWRNRILYKYGWSPEKLAEYYYGNSKRNLLIFIFTFIHLVL